MLDILDRLDPIKKKERKIELLKYDIEIAKLKRALADEKIKADKDLSELKRQIEEQK